MSLLDLVKEAHSLLDPISQNMKTTAIGSNVNGDLFIASSNNTVPPVQRIWASNNNITPISGVGHAEETLIKSGNNITHIDASKPVCIDCENLMNENGVTTNTSKSGKKSKNRQGGSCNT